MRDPKYDILFEPVKIGPVQTRNRFYQVPHCSGMGYRYPNAEARMRGIKAEGGWGVVSTQETEIHPTSDLSPANEARLWDDSDIPNLKLMSDAVHEHDSLAAIQLAYNGMHAPNRYSRLPPMSPSHAALASDDPYQAREMDKADIKAFRGWHVDAAKRAKRAGFDIIYVYAGHDMTLLQHFLLARHNHRSDEYGGSFENRLRLFREVIEDTKIAVGDTCAIAVRLAVDELMGPDGFRHEVEGRDIIEALAEEPDLWDVNLADWSNDSQTSRFAKEGYQEPYTAFVKSVTTKPVVGVGRYTSPDKMVDLIKKNQMDLIGAARPSIADPFLPSKISEGRLEDIRECIGCNICVTGDNTNSPMRCTQNPTVGEEWRRDWHPEILPNTPSSKKYLIIGGGPSGLEAATSLIKSGNDVVLADGANYWGGRVTLESKLPGLAEWARVRDWRMWQLQQVSNANLYLNSQLSSEDILSYGIENIVLATGASWRSDGVGRVHRQSLKYLNNDRNFTPDDIMMGKLSNDKSTGPIVIFDDDRFYMGSIVAEVAIKTGRKVVFVTSTPNVAAWSENTLEQGRIQSRLIKLGVEIIASHELFDQQNDRLHIACSYSGNTREIHCDTLILVTSRLPNDLLWKELLAKKEDWSDAGINTVTRIGDCLQPGLIAMAVQSGHNYVREIIDNNSNAFRREDQNFAR
ncbi:MAG: FAD-dependent oxidoreductase [Paracoccaceae bacterium]|nr:FAD-dependent oxidoreductase [Paracoccaceae bacterium]